MEKLLWLKWNKTLQGVLLKENKLQVTVIHHTTLVLIILPQQQHTQGFISPFRNDILFQKPWLIVVHTQVKGQRLPDFVFPPACFPEALGFLWMGGGERS